MKKIGLITDVHGNLPALTAILAELDREGCDEIIHLGDVVDMGPNSAECLHLLLSRKDVTMIMGNHDKDFLFDDYIAKKLSHVPTEHKRYVFDSLTDDDRAAVSKFPLFCERECGGKTLLFVHYAYTEWSYRRVSVPYDMDKLRRDIMQLPCGKEIFDFYFLRNNVTF